MRVLLVGSADSIWLKKYIDSISGERGVELSILSPDNGAFRDFYIDKKICIYSDPFTQVNVSNGEVGENINKTRRKSVKEIIKTILPDFVVKRIYYFLLGNRVEKLLASTEAFDAIHFHYISDDLDLIYSRAIRRYVGQIILTYWGSDLLRKGSSKNNRRIIKRADSIVFLSQKLFDCYREIYGSKEDNKLKTIGFGISGYDYIDEIYSGISKTDAKSLFSFPEGKICVAIGYNASEAQQHVNIIKAIGCLPQEVKNEIHLVFQFSYGRSDDNRYYDLIDQELDAAGCSWTVINDFLDDVSTASLRWAVDIFIHAQITDSLSASMLEYLYAGATVINGAWLKYPILSDLDSRCLTFDDFDSLTCLIESIVVGYRGKGGDNLVIRNKLRSINSWEAVQPLWLDLYMV